PHIRSLNSPSALEEERRLMYVGVTRAKDRLYLTYSRKRISFMGGNAGSTNYTIASRFLNEISSECMTGFSPDPESLFRSQSAKRSFDSGDSQQSSRSRFDRDET